MAAHSGRDESRAHGLHRSSYYDAALRDDYGRSVGSSIVLADTIADSGSHRVAIGLLCAGVRRVTYTMPANSGSTSYHKLFNMDGKLYYRFRPRPHVSFFMLESSYPVPEQLQSLEQELKASDSQWKVPDRHGSVFVTVSGR